MKNNQELLFQNLKDAGCSTELIEKIFRLEPDGKLSEIINLLRLHKTSLLNSLHQAQKKIDCLDYLIFNLEQKKQERKK